MKTLKGRLIRAPISSFHFLLVRELVVDFVHIFLQSINTRVGNSAVLMSWLVEDPLRLALRSYMEKASGVLDLDLCSWWQE